MPGAVGLDREDARRRVLVEHVFAPEQDQVAIAAPKEIWLTGNGSFNVVVTPVPSLFATLISLIPELPRQKHNSRAVRRPVVLVESVHGRRHDLCVGAVRVGDEELEGPSQSRTSEDKLVPCARTSG